MVSAFDPASGSRPPARDLVYPLVYPCLPPKQKQKSRCSVVCVAVWVASRGRGCWSCVRPMNDCHSCPVSLSLFPRLLAMCVPHDALCPLPVPVVILPLGLSTREACCHQHSTHRGTIWGSCLGPPGLSCLGRHIFAISSVELSSTRACPVP